MNINFISGRLGKDAELRQAGSSQVCSFSVAASSGFGDKKQTHWYECSVWGNQGAALSQFLKKGKEVVIAGEFSEREYQGKFHKQINVLKIDLVGGDPQGQQPQNNQGQQNYQQPQGQPMQNQQPQNNQSFNNQMNNNAQDTPKDDSIPF